MSGVTKPYRIRNEIIRGTAKVGELSKKVQESSRLNSSMEASHKKHRPHT